MLAMPSTTTQDLIASTIASLDERLAEIEPTLVSLTEEKAKLSKARAALSDEQPRAARPSRGKRSGPPAIEQVPSLLADKGPMTVSEIATSLDCTTGYLYTALPRAEKAGKVRKEGDKWASAATKAEKGVKAPAAAAA